MVFFEVVAMTVEGMAQDLAAYPSAMAPDHHVHKSDPSATDVITTNAGDSIRQLAQPRTQCTSTAIRHRYHGTSPPSLDPCTPGVFAWHFRTRRHKRRTSTWLRNTCFSNRGAPVCLGCSTQYVACEAAVGCCSPGLPPSTHVVSSSWLIIWIPSGGFFKMQGKVIAIPARCETALLCKCLQLATRDREVSKVAIRMVQSRTHHDSRANGCAIVTDDRLTLYLKI
ncbi:hypothetical protein BDU57DRAFT_598925 [Ampelomyces quisqualis]|uniref:Uncharacterized protein n=1 Tax=Ampelomyces quisqualis TaxID=50730 RepID=A0A6A5Q8L5_AMPQU|nr:hypothetical protein BDU57DRAFT_598925 [Ampelomyces quisqualis]